MSALPVITLRNSRKYKAFKPVSGSQTVKVAVIPVRTKMGLSVMVAISGETETTALSGCVLSICVATAIVSSQVSRSAPAVKLYRSMIRSVSLGVSQVSESYSIPTL